MLARQPFGDLALSIELVMIEKHILRGILPGRSRTSSRDRAS